MIFDWHNRALLDDLHFVPADGIVLLASSGHEADAWLELTAPEDERWQALERFAVRGR